MFSGFNFEVGGNTFNTEPGYKRWHDIHKIYEKNQNLSANLRKAAKSTYQVLHTSL